MSLLKSLNRHMERNQVTRLALMDVYEKSAIKDLDDFSLALWSAIKESQNRNFLIELENCDDVPFEFIVKLLVKIGFSSDNAARLLMRLHRHGVVTLATADEENLLKLEQYIHFQARKHNLSLRTCVRAP
jgi:ATP-dependent Clp protease adapter protein ClpS